MKRILVVDDHSVVRKGLAMLLNRQPDLEVCGEAEDAPQALDAVESLRPDLVILDISLKGVDGIELLKQIKARWPALLALVFSRHDELVYADRALRAGATGYVMKLEADDVLIKAVRQVLAGRIYVSDEINNRLVLQALGGRKAASGSPLDHLTDRELEVFTLVGHGYKSTEIAEQTNLSVKTVESYRSRIKGKLNLEGNEEFIQFAVQWVDRERTS